MKITVFILIALLYMSTSSLVEGMIKNIEMHRELSECKNENDTLKRKIIVLEGMLE